jgi:FKBP-type peptidyl-prolyl cis-trans isomerase FkpA
VTGLNRVLSAGLLGLFVVAGCVPPPSSNSGTPRVLTAPPDAAAPPAAKNASPETPDSLPDSRTEPGPDDPDAPEEFTETATGLKYRILRQGDGRKPTTADSVNCHYRGTLDDGSEFDSSYSKGASISFPLTRVIAGWTQGLQLVSVGGKIELEIPYQLGYGESGKPPSIPPKSTLHFIVELIAIE